MDARRFKDSWDNSFTAITGVIGLGEGVKPPHERADELIALLVERGADPIDLQSFYNISIVDDDPLWLDVLWQHAVVRGVTDQWRRVTAKPIGGPLAESPLDFMLGLAVANRHRRRVEWLLAHGANPNSRNAYSGRTQREEALVHGAEEISAQLEQYGAQRVSLDGRVGFLVACRKSDLDEARRLAALHPEVLHDSEPMITAAREGQLATVELLLDLGMDVDIADGGGTRALVYLGLKDRLAELFVAEPELLNLRHSRSRDTPLHSLPPEETLALEMARFLLERGADKGLRDQSGATPAEVARKRGFNAVTELLS